MTTEFHKASPVTTGANAPSTEIPTVELHGTARQRGQGHGSFARDQIHRALDYYSVALPAQTQLDWATVQKRARKWAAPSHDFAPDLIDEMEGIAEGAGVSFEDILTLNVRGEVVYDSGRADVGKVEALDGCTSFAIEATAAGDGHVYCGQNWDWRWSTRTTVMLMRLVFEDRPTIIMQTEAGQVGRQGANSVGIALNANGLGGRFDDSPGIPQTLIRRRTLEAATLSDALSVLVDTPGIIASNALLTSSQGFAIDLETTPKSIDWLYPTDGILVHGNHYQGRIPPQLSETYRPFSVSSLYRQHLVATRLQECRAEQSSDALRKVIQDAMSDHVGYPDAVCCHAQPALPEASRWSTIISSCVDLTTGEYLVTAGNPCQTQYARAPWGLYETSSTPSQGPQS